MATGVEVKGAARLQATMTRAGREFARMDGANARVGADVATMARGYAPRRTGRLSRSISGRAGPGNTAEIVGTVVYAGVIHNGWPRHGIRRNPYIKRAVEGSTERWVGEYKTEVDKILNTVKGV